MGLSVVPSRRLRLPAGVVPRGGPAVVCLWALLACLPAGAQTAAPVKLPLDAAIDEALRNNIGLLAERASIGVAEAKVITARLRPNPVVSLEADHIDWLGTGFNDVNAGGPTEMNVHTDFLIERGRKRQLRTEAALAVVSVAELNYRNVARNLVLDIQNSYLDALLARESLALAKSSLESFQRIVEINTQRLRAGDLAEVELIRSRIAALQFQNSVHQSELRLRAALVRLQVLLGRSRASAPIEIAGDFRRDLVIPSLDELHTTARALRPDLLALRRDVARSQYETRLQLAQGKVDYTVGTEYRRQQVNAKSNSVGFSFQFPLPVFNRNQGEIERARREEAQTALRVRAAETSITGEVDGAWQQFQTARELLENIEKNMLQQARDVREITEYSYRRGDSTLLELLDAQRAFNDTMQGYNEARAEYARNLYLLDSVAGKLDLPQPGAGANTQPGTAGAPPAGNRPPGF